MTQYLIKNSYNNYLYADSKNIAFTAKDNATIFTGKGAVVRQLNLMRSFYGKTKVELTMEEV